MADNFLLGTLRVSPGLIDARTIDNYQLRDVVTPKGMAIQPGGYIIPNPSVGAVLRVISGIANTTRAVASPETTPRAKPIGT